MGEAWFEAKTYGFGSGLPCHWKGWALIAGLIVGLGLVAVVANSLLPRVPALIIMLLADAILVGLFCMIAARKTRGGWRWRWGDSERPPPS